MCLRHHSLLYFPPFSALALMLSLSAREFLLDRVADEGGSHLAHKLWRRLQPRDGRMAHTIATRDIHQRLARLAPCQSLLPLMRSGLGRAAKATLARPTFLWYQGFRCRANP